MPTVEPFPISDPFSTMGKVNLNYEMMPFTHVKRATALHAVLKSERLLAIPNQNADDYKKLTASHQDGASRDRWRTDLEAVGTSFLARKDLQDRFRGVRDVPLS